MIMKMRPIIITTAILVVALCFVSVGQAAPEKLGGGVHVVQWGENLASIALRYGTSVDAIAQANGITNQDYIYIGQQLAIPAMGNLGPQQMNLQMGQMMNPQMGLQTDPQMAQQMQMGQQMNPQFAMPAAASGVAMGASPYTVQFGDTLTSISLRNGISVDTLMQANGLPNSTIYIGQPLMIPGGSMPAPSAAMMQSPAQMGMGMGTGPSSYYAIKTG